MNRPFRVWIYRPDYEAAERKINKLFVYNGGGKNYFEVLEKENEIKRLYFEIKARNRFMKARSKIEVPNN